MKTASAPFSLLLPVYRADSAQFFERALLSSTTEQTLQPQQVVIVRDGPVSDELQAALQRVKRELPIPVTLVELETNVGLAIALNRGLAACEHEVIARIDADDISLPERFERQWQLMLEGYDLVGTGMVEFERDLSTLGKLRVPPVGFERIRQHAKTHNPFNHPTMMYRRRTLAGIGDYQPFGSMEDYWLGIRLIDGGAKVANLSDPLVAYRVGSGAFVRRGGVRQAKTELVLQRQLLRMGFITRFEYVRNVVVKGTYRVLPSGIKRQLFHRFIGGGLRGDRKQRDRAQSGES